MLQLREPGSEGTEPHPGEGTPAVSWDSLRWVLGVLPWILVVVLLAMVDGGCAPVEPEDGVPEPTPFPYYGDDDDSAAGDDDDGIGGPYPSILVPDFDQTGVSRLAGLWIEMSEEGVPATVGLSRGGEPVPGSSRRVGAVRFLFLPDAPLAPLTTYQMTAAWGEDSSLSWSFTTRDARPAVGSPDGVTLRWDIGAAGASSPPGGEAFVGALPLSVLTELSGDGPAVLGGLSEQDAEPLVQDLCVATFEPTAAAPAIWEDPLLSTPPTVVRLSVDLALAGFGIEVLPLRDVRFLAELSGDEAGVTGIAEGSFFGWVDTREVAVVGICDTLSGVAIECVPCPGDGAEQCLVFALEGIQGAAVDLALTTRSAVDVKGDPACQPLAR